MALSKSDNPESKAKTASDKETDEAVEEVLDAGAGVPAGYEEAAEALPEKDEVQKAHKEAALAETGQEEAQAKAKIVEASPDSPETPSGAALLETAGIEDNVERGNEYARVKSMHRWGYVVPALNSDKGK